MRFVANRELGSWQSEDKESCTLLYDAVEKPDVENQIGEI